MTARALAHRMLHAIGVALINVVDDTGSTQQLQVTDLPGPDGAPGVTDGVWKVAQFGFASNPPANSEAVVLRLWGNRTLTIALGTNHQPSRLKNLSPGDSALYDQRGAFVWLTPAGLVIDGHGLAATIRNVGTLTLTGDLHVTGKLTTNSDATIGGAVTATGVVSGSAIEAAGTTLSVP